MLSTLQTVPNDLPFCCFNPLFVVICKCEPQERGLNLMDNEVRLNTFPSNKLEALTMLILNNQDLSTSSTEEIVRKYDEIYNEVNKNFKEIASKKTKFKF